MSSRNSLIARVATLASIALLASSVPALAGPVKFGQRSINPNKGPLSAATRLPAPPTSGVTPTSPSLPVTAGLPPVTLTVDDAGFTEAPLDVSGVPAGTYNHFSITTNWAPAAGSDAWSSESSFALANPDITTIYKYQTSFSNGVNTVAPRTLTYSGYFYQPYTAGNPLSLFGTDDFESSTWSNTVVTLDQAATPTVSATQANQGGSTAAGALAAGAVKFFKFNYDGSALTLSTEGSTASADTVLALFNSTGGFEALDDDSGTGSLSSLAIPAGALPAGQYYVGVTSYSSALAVDDGFVFSSSGGAAIGSLVVNGISVVPEPATLAALGFAGMIFRRRR